MDFEDLPTTPRSEELLDKAFSRAARAGRAKSGHDAQSSMLQTAASITADNLENVVRAWPDFDGLHPFHAELADATLAETTVGSVDDLRQQLSSVSWATRQIRSLRSDYEGRIRTNDVDTARKLRKQAFARIADIVDEVAPALEAIGTARDALRHLPEINPDEPTIVVAGYPNVGKSSFVNHVTNAREKTGSYPYTTTQIGVGHVTHRHIRYQLVDTPGLLDRPAADRNAIESQAVSALTHVADVVVVLLDASETCGYTFEDQRALLEDIRNRFDVPVIAVSSKADLETWDGADRAMSIDTGDGVDEVIEAAIEATGYEPELPFEQ